MKKRLTSLILLLSMSFNIAHAYAIEAIDTHPCQASEFVQIIDESSQTVDADGDICHLHHFFHIAFILPETLNGVSEHGFTQKPDSNTKIFKCNTFNNFLKPPIHA